MDIKKIFFNKTSIYDLKCFLCKQINFLRKKMFYKFKQKVEFVVQAKLPGKKRRIQKNSESEFPSTRFRRKRHSRYIGLWKLITNAVGLKKNSKRHIFKAQDLPFPIANSKFFNILLIMKKCCLNKKKHDFSALFFFKLSFQELSCQQST